MELEFNEKHFGKLVKNCELYIFLGRNEEINNIAKKFLKEKKKGYEAIKKELDIHLFQKKVIKEYEVNDFKKKIIEPDLINEQLEDCFKYLENYIKKADKSHQEENDHGHAEEPEENIKDYSDLDMFNGCDNVESIEKRYRKLMKEFHPDNPNGDIKMTQRINLAHEKILEKYS